MAVRMYNVKLGPTDTNAATITFSVDSFKLASTGGDITGHGIDDADFVNLGRGTWSFPLDQATLTGAGAPASGDHAVLILNCSGVADATNNQYQPIDIFPEDNRIDAAISSRHASGAAVASVTGDVGGNVVGSVGSIATGGIVAASFASAAITAAAIATDALGAAELATDSVTEIVNAIVAHATITGIATNAANAASDAAEASTFSEEGRAFAQDAKNAAEANTDILESLRDDLLLPVIGYKVTVGADSTTTQVNTNAAGGADAYNGQVLLVQIDYTYQWRFITDFDGAGAFTLDHALTVAPENGWEARVMPFGDMISSLNALVTDQTRFAGADIASTLTQATNAASDASDALAAASEAVVLAERVRKLAEGRDLLDENTNKQIRYEADSNTELQRWALKDKDGNPTHTNIRERRPEITYP